MNLYSDINVTPFVDVMLVLLIIFMVSTPLLLKETNLDLPSTTAMNDAQNSDAIILSLNNKGKFFLKDQEFSTPLDLINGLKQQGEIHLLQDKQVLVQADKNLNYEAILKFLSLLQENGFNKISLASLASD